MYHVFGSKVFALEVLTYRTPQTAGDPSCQWRNIGKVDCRCGSIPQQITLELMAGLGVCDKTMLINLKQIEKLEMLEKWELSEGHEQTRIECCLRLLNRFNDL